MQVWSAGVEIHGLNSNAIRVMAEAGVDISAHRSKDVGELKHIPFDVVVTVCDHARESCPIFPRPVRQIHHQPPQLVGTDALSESHFTLRP